MCSMRVAGATVPHDDYMSPAEGREMGAGEIEDYLAGGELSAEALDSLSYKRWLSTDSEAGDATKDAGGAGRSGVTGRAGTYALPLGHV